MNKRQLLAAVLSGSLLAAALPGLALAQDEEVTYAAEDIAWTLELLSGASVPEGVEVTMLLSGGEVGGNAGCNSYSGSYEIDETSLTFGEEFAVTLALCEGPAQEVEDAYLPLLQSTAGWSVVDEKLVLTDDTGAETLLYGQPPIDVTATDVAALNAELDGLQSQIDEAEVVLEEVVAAAQSVNINKIRNRIGANEDDIAALQDKTKGLNVDNIKKRLNTLESAVADLDKQLQNTKKRVKDLETVAKNHEERIEALEAGPEQPLP